MYKISKKNMKLYDILKVYFKPCNMLLSTRLCRVQLTCTCLVGAPMFEHNLYVKALKFCMAVVMLLASVFYSLLVLYY